MSVHRKAIEAMLIFGTLGLVVSIIAHETVHMGILSHYGCGSELHIEWPPSVTPTDGCIDSLTQSEQKRLYYTQDMAEAVGYHFFYIATFIGVVFGQVSVLLIHANRN